LNVRLTDHAYWRWHQRSEKPSIHPLVAWARGETVSGTALEGDEVRFHRETDTCIVRKNQALVTVVDASNATRETRQAVAAIDGGGSA